MNLVITSNLKLKIIVFVVISCIANANSARIRYQRRINLSDQKLENIDPELFFENHDLEMLELNNNPRLGSIPNQIFLIHQELNDLQLRECNFEIIDWATFSKLPNLKMLDISGSNISAISSNAFQNNLEMTNLDLESNQIKEFSLAGRNYLPNLYILVLNYNNEIGTGLDLRHENSKLSAFHCSRCGITEITAKTFDSLVSLSTLALRSNKISRIHAESFANNNILKILDISYNPIGSEITEFPYIRELTHFICEHCEFRTVTKHTFMNFRHLTLLNLAFNDIHSVDVESFSHLQLLANIFLHHNKLTAFNTRTVDDIKSIEILCLDGNPFVPSKDHREFKEYYAEKGLRDPKECDILNKIKFKEDNRDPLIGLVLLKPDDFKYELYLPNPQDKTAPEAIIYINVSFMDPHFFEDREFKPNQVLQISGSQDAEFVPDDQPILYQKTLTHFVCSACGIDEIYPDTLKEIPSLEVMELPRNKIRKIDKNGIQSEKLTELVLTDNEILFVDTEAIVNSKLKILSLDGNTKFNFPRGEPFLISDTLEEFSCVNCGITHLDNETFSKLPNLRKLNLTNNDITFDAVVFLNGIVTLSLGGNLEINVPRGIPFIFSETLETFLCDSCGAINAAGLPNLKPLSLVNTNDNNFKDFNRDNIKPRLINTNYDYLNDFVSDISPDTAKRNEMLVEADSSEAINNRNEIRTETIWEKVEIARMKFSTLYITIIIIPFVLFGLVVTFLIYFLVRMSNKRINNSKNASIDHHLTNNEESDDDMCGFSSHSQEHLVRMNNVSHTQKKHIFIAEKVKYFCVSHPDCTSIQLQIDGGAKDETELTAINRAVLHVLDDHEPGIFNVVSDSMSSLQSIQYSNHPGKLTCTIHLIRKNLRKAMQKGYMISIFSFPGHNAPCIRLI